MTRADRRPWSCDSFVVLPTASADGSMLLGKNSDRPVNETQPLRYVPARAPAGSERLQLAYVEIADDRQTLAHVGASPYWCWGHELGLNERGVAIGNEALFTRDLAHNQRAARAGEAPEPGHPRDGASSPRARTRTHGRGGDGRDDGPARASWAVGRRRAREDARRRCLRQLLRRRGRPRGVGARDERTPMGRVRGARLVVVGLEPGDDPHRMGPRQRRPRGPCP